MFQMCLICTFSSSAYKAWSLETSNLEFSLSSTFSGLQSYSFIGSVLKARIQEQNYLSLASVVIRRFLGLTLNCATYEPLPSCELNAFTSWQSRDFSRQASRPNAWGRDRGEGEGDLDTEGSIVFWNKVDNYM